MEFGYDKELKELLVFYNGRLIGSVYHPLDEEELKYIQYEIKSGTFFVIYENEDDEIGDYGDD